MQVKNKVNILITATAKGVGAATKQVGSDIKTGITKGRQAVKAFNDTVGNGRKSISLLSGSIKTLLAGMVGFQAIRNATSIMKDADTAAFSMQTSVAAANREFEKVGTVKEWEGTIRNLSNELKIYSDTALKNAVSRTVDMTKRLGLSKDQMEEVIKRSADLGAGKVELEGAIERVTAALRGEAESAEYLGLTLNENYIKAVYEANEANRKAWKDLTDLEKAQARYTVFLQQSEQFQGRAADSANTFAGSLAEIKKEIVNAVSNSKDLQDAMQGVATLLRSNSGEIGKVISTLVTAAARVAEFAIEWKGLLIGLAGTAAAVAIISKLVLTVKALNAAFAVITGSGILTWMVNLKTAIIGVASQATLAGIAMKAGLAAAAAWGVVQIGLAVKALYQWRVAAKEAREAQARLAESTTRVMRKYEEFKNVQLPGNLTQLAQEDLAKFRQELAGARAYYTALKYKLEEKAAGKTIFGTTTDEALEAQKELKVVNARLKEIQEDFAKVGEAASGAAGDMEKPATAIEATTEQLDEFEKKAKAAYDEAKKQAANYAQQVIAWEDKIKYAKLSTEDKVRELGRKGMQEAEVWADKKLQAEEKLYAAKKAMAKGDYELAKKLAKEAEELYADLATEVKGTEKGSEVVKQSLEDTKEVAINGVTEVGKFVEQLYGKQKDAAKKARDEWSATAKGINRQLDAIAKQREANIKIQLQGLEAAQNAINQLTRDETKHVTVVTHYTSVTDSSGDTDTDEETKRFGGLAGLARGGRLPGFGGGDRVRALLEAGEYVVRKEAVKKYGVNLLHALNSMKLNLNGMARAKIGGLISNISIPAMPAPQFAFQGGGSVPGVSGETMTVRFQAGNTEMPLTVIGDRRVTRGMVKQFEKELLKMGLSKR